MNTQIIAKIYCNGKKREEIYHYQSKATALRSFRNFSKEVDARGIYFFAPLEYKLVDKRGSKILWKRTNNN